MGAYLGNNKKLKLMINNVAFKIQPGKITKCDHEYTSTVIAPSCTAQGYTKYTCALCGSIYNGNYVAKLDHVVVTIPGYDATTEAPGLTDGQKCNVCGTILKAQEIIPIIPTPGEEECTHTDTDYRYEDVFDATCTEDGHYWQVEYCTNCTKDLNREYITTDATGHSWGDLITDVPATESTPGSGHRDCLNNCGEQMIETIPELGHIHTEETLVAVPATCTTTGLTEGKKCSTCGETLVAQIEIKIDPTNHTGEEISGGTAESHLEYSCCGQVINSAHNYDQDSGVEYKAATCTTNRKNYLACSCGYNPQLIAYVTEVKDSKLGHTEVIDDAVDATCTSTGLTEGKHCSVCNAILIAQQPVSATGHVDKDNNYICDVCDEDLCTEETHVIKILDAVPATCTTTGLTEGEQCERCGDILKAQETIPAKGHTKVTDDAVDPTCTETGLTEGSHCSVCDETLVEQEIIEANGHSYESEVTEPTCTEDGYTTYTCSVCGDSYTANYVNKTDHDYIAVVTEPTCTTGGYTTHTCSVCNDSYTDNEVDATGHTEVIDKAVDATCKDTGLTEGSHCSVCDEILVEQEETPMLDHDFVGGSCHICGQPEHIFGGDNDPCYCEIHQTYEHIWGDPVEEGDNRATCEIDGEYDLVKYCTRPGCEEKEVLETAVPEEGGHILGEGGYCTRCGDYINEHVFGGDNGPCYCEIHEVEEHSWQDATCEEPKTCSVCKITEGEPLGHTPGEPVKTETAEMCTYIYIQTCTACSTVVNTSVPVTEHSYVDDDDMTPECICTVCNEHDDRNIANCYCPVCDREFHNKTEYKEIPATCEEDGMTEGWYCDICETDTREVITKFGHSWKDGQCTRCEEYCTDHQIVRKEDITQPTCNTDGEKVTTWLCDICGAVESSSTEAITDRPDHTPGTPTLKDTDDNMCDCEEVICCTICNKELSRKTVPNHAWGDGDMDPACTCTNCSEHKTDYIDDNCYCSECRQDFHKFGTDGKCQNGVCEAECDHDYSNSCVCPICGHENHSFVNGTCENEYNGEVCGESCPYRNVDPVSGICKDCGGYASHHGVSG